jgi:hypothetical protein
MKRLSDLPAEDRLSSRAHVLIRATGATVQSEERRLRVRRLLDAPLRAQALRRDGDVERALQLLEHGASVTGPFAEEALALRLEAAVVRGNGRQAKLAAAYLTRYPQGRYRELAERALSGSGR